MTALIIALWTFSKSLWQKRLAVLIPDETFQNLRSASVLLLWGKVEHGCSQLTFLPGNRSWFGSKNRRNTVLDLDPESRGRYDTQLPADVLDKLPQPVSAEDKLWELMCNVYELKRTRHDLLIRSLTLEFPELHQALARVDKLRFQTVRGLFAEMGFKGEVLDMRTLVFITTTSLDRLMLVDVPNDAYKHQLKLRHEFFVRP